MNDPMPCLASFFDAMSGVKKLTNFVPAITCPHSANEPSINTLSGIVFFHYAWHKTAEALLTPVVLGQKWLFWDK